MLDLHAEEEGNYGNVVFKKEIDTSYFKNFEVALLKTMDVLN